ncbi:B12-binding domain-containing protein [Pseudosporangium ferrugineum]
MRGGDSDRSSTPETAADVGSGRGAAPGAATGSESDGAGDSQAGADGYPSGPGGSRPGFGDSRPGSGGSASDAGDVVPLHGGRAGRGRSIDVVWPEFAGSLTVSTRDGGGHTIRTGRAGPAARGLARAAMRLDGPSLRDILEMAVAGRGVVGAWEEVIMPVLIGIGDRYEATRRFIEVEHLISRSVTEVLGTVARPPTGQVPRVLLAAADEEQHTLPLEALAAALAEAGVASRFFGARVPTPALIDAVARTGPAAVVLWSQLPETGDPEQWVQLLSSGHAPLLSAAAGPGWPADGLPEGVVRIGSLQEGVRLVAAAAAPELPDFPTGRAQQSQ